MPGRCYQTVLQPFLAIYVSIPAKVNRESSRMGGVETKISPAGRKAGHDVDRGCCQYKLTPKGYLEYQIFGQKNRPNSKNVGKFQGGCFWTFSGPLIMIPVSIYPKKILFGHYQIGGVMLSCTVPSHHRIVSTLPSSTLVVTQSKPFLEAAKSPCSQRPTLSLPKKRIAQRLVGRRHKRSPPRKAPRPTLFHVAHVTHDPSLARHRPGPHLCWEELRLDIE